MNYEVRSMLPTTCIVFTHVREKNQLLQREKYVQSDSVPVTASDESRDLTRFEFARAL